MAKDNLTGATVLVTGAAGFIGSFLSRRLLERGDVRVIGLDNINDYYDTSLKRARLDMVREHDANGLFSFNLLDLVDQEGLEALFSAEKPEYVVNLAGQAGVRHSIDCPRDYIDANIYGFLNVLECCRHHPVRHLVYASSSSVYGMVGEGPCPESDRADRPVSLCAATKRANELMAYSYANLYGIPATGLRFFTVYGPMGRPDMAYFKFAERLHAKEPITVYNCGDMLRDFTYVEDVVDAVIAVTNKPPVPGASCDAAGPDDCAGYDGGPVPHRVYNVGHSCPVRLSEFIEELEQALAREGVIELPTTHIDLPMQPGDVYRTYADTTALERDFGVHPTTTVAEGLSAFAHWYAQWCRR